MSAQLDLDHVQRLNLHALLGQQTAIVGQIRPIWALQKRLDLNKEEAAAIGLNRDAMTWDAGGILEPKQFTFTDTEVSLIRPALERATFPAAARSWLEPLLDVFLPE